MGTLISIVPYDTAWPCVYRETRHRFELLLTELVATIEHVGSAAVPDLAAKPYIDLILSIPTSRTIAAHAWNPPSSHGDGVFAFMVRDPLPSLRVYLCPSDSLTHHNRMQCVIYFARTPLLPMTTRRLRWPSPRNTMTMAMPIRAPNPISFVKR